MMKGTNHKCTFVEYFKYTHFCKPNSYEDKRKLSSFQSISCSALIPEATAVPSIFCHGLVWPVIKCHGKGFVWYVLLF